MHQLSRCPGCGASIPPRTIECRYCGAHLVQRPEARPLPPGVYTGAAVPPPPRLDLSKGEFGIPGALPLLFVLGGAVGLCALGWSLERPDTYWSRDEAVAMWIGAIPALALTVALVWRPRWGRWWAGLLVGVFVAIVQIVSTAVVVGRINDDVIGLGALVGLTAAVGWLVGAAIHYGICHGRATALAREATRT